MKEIKQQDFQKILPLYLQSKMDFPLIRAVLEQKQDGYIWVDYEAMPQNVFVRNKFGFIYLFGDGKNYEFNEWFYNLIFTDSGYYCKYLLWYDPPQVWQKKMNEMTVPNIKMRKRIQFRFEREKFVRYSRFICKIPEGYEVKKVDAGMLEKIKCFNLDIENRFWRSASDFLQNGFAFCLVTKDDSPASICYTACIVNNKAEIDVATLTQYRGQRLATIITIAFIEYCLQNDIMPNWDCFLANESSYRLAKTLGFKEETEYKFFSVYRDFSGKE